LRKTGADVDEVAYVMGKDRRIGPKFLKASIGFGGSCFKKDILNLVYLCGYYGLPEVAAYWESVVKINEWQTHRVVDRMLETMFNTIAGKKIAVFGFAFKANTGDTRESPANLVVRDLLAEHAQPVVTDPKAIPDAKRDLKDVIDQVQFEEDPYKAAEGAHAVVVCTDGVLCRLDWTRIYKVWRSLHSSSTVRNILDADALRKIGFEVSGIGKGKRNNIECMVFGSDALGEVMHTRNC
jgi:Predicted UDP-glucose 6-dehydrogenase